MRQSGGFHQVPRESESRDITSFSTDDGSFSWKVLPFGLSISLNSFSRMMHIAFSGLPPDKMFVYIDAIIITGCFESHHINNLEEVFQICRKRNLRINLEKWTHMLEHGYIAGYIQNTNCWKIQTSSRQRSRKTVCRIYALLQKIYPKFRSCRCTA